MARIPDDEIERLKKKISLERLVTGFGIELPKHGADLIGRCPFHDDREPSLIRRRKRISGTVSEPVIPDLSVTVIASSIKLGRFVTVWVAGGYPSTLNRQ